MGATASRDVPETRAGNSAITGDYLLSPSSETPVSRTDGVVIDGHDQDSYALSGPSGAARPYSKAEQAADLEAMAWRELSPSQRRLILTLRSDDARD
jgi:hypothetical protein